MYAIKTQSDILTYYITTSPNNLKDQVISTLFALIIAFCTIKLQAFYAEKQSKSIQLERNNSYLKLLIEELEYNKKVAIAYLKSKDSNIFSSFTNNYWESGVLIYIQIFDKNAFNETNTLYTEIRLLKQFKSEFQPIEENRFEQIIETCNKFIKKNA